MNKKIVFMDIDGTLVDNQENISRRNKDCITKLLNQGFIFYVATGRMFYSAKIIANRLDHRVNVLAANGGAFSVNNKVYSANMSLPTIAKIIKFSNQMNVPVFLFSKDSVYYTLQLPDYFKATDKNRVANPNSNSYVHITSTEQIINKKDTITNAIAIDDSEDKENLYRMKLRLGKISGIDISSSMPNNIEIMVHGISKATAIHKICNLLQIPITDTISFGDGNNDIPMINKTGLGIAMENGTKQIKAQADFITKSNLDSGVAVFLERYLTKA